MRMNKAIRILSTILVLSIITSFYCIIAAPLLEPASKYQKVELKRDNSSMSVQQIMTLFNPNDWEVTSARHLEINNFHIFAGENTKLSGSSINIDKCTIVIVNSVKPLKAITIKCLGNISLEFSQPISFQERQSENRLLSGTLNGKIHVFSKGEEENLSFETEDFNISKDRVWTRANVFFKYGHTQGVGSGMQIQLINHGLFGSPENSFGSGPISQKIENITLQKLQRLTIVPPAPKHGDRQDNNSGFFSAPIELRCDGPFIFNALNKYASFEQNVSLIQTASNKAPNSIRCQYLILYFGSADSDKKVSEGAQKAESESSFNDWNLQLERLEASGSPVVIEAPEYQTKIHTSRLIANLNPLSFELDSTTTNQQCEIHYKNHLISTQNLIYKVGDNGTLGTLECNCSGWTSSQMNETGKQIRVRWKNGLHLEPDRNDPTESIVSIQGSARLEIENNNKTEAGITADGFFFWLTQKTKPAAANGVGELTLSRMQANNNVIMKSNPITANVKTIQLWFEDLGNAEAGEAQTANAEYKQNMQSSSNSAEFQIPNSESGYSYSVSGNLLQGKILLGQNQFQISELTLKDEIRIVQNNPLASNDQEAGRLEMSGSLIQVFNLTLPSATVSLIGQPARIRYNNMSLSGAAINVNRGINRVWIDSGGEALFLGGAQGVPGGSDSPSANSTAVPYSFAMGEPAKIKWSKSMVFQDDTLTFNGDVSLQRKDQFAQCDELSIVLNKKADLQNLNSADLQKSLDVNYIVLNNSVKLENITAENGVTNAMDCLTTSKATIDMKKQTFVAEGPGRAMTQRRIKGNDVEAAEEGNGQEAADSNAQASQQPLSQLAPRSSQLVNLSVDFQKRLEGSFAPHSLSTFTFSGRVEAVYSPIDEIGKPIKTFNLSELPPEAFTLKCNQMEIQAELGNAELGNQQEVAGGSDSPSANSANTRSSRLAPRASSFIASGGVTVEGRVYNANADKITFEAKNGIMTLEGDGQIPAQFFYQKVLGGRYSQASSAVIHYNTQTGAVKGEGIQEFSLFLTPKTGKE